ncbi:polyphosphate--glucose phosphotransferase [Glutamicibacter sp. V16R2B1]|uniref:polyphosphate--glucose phosphotransferase n=1 Tax=Glutamicibacter TaxID=1742989 RepID=UPI0010FF3356|nr:ROK family protein [Glutamicibacter sp. V16R2B1]TLK49875.1 ROK family protein [Glutamicibacter sp. V16R2B1]
MVQQRASQQERLGFGIDVGGTGMKGGIVDLTTGKLVGKRFRMPTPKPSLPEAVAEVAAAIYSELRSREGAPLDDAPLGIAVPCIVHHGVARSAANVDKSFIGTDLVQLFGKTLSRDVVMLNDADAAGLAEGEYGAGRNVPGSVMTLTLGTGIGSALLFNGQLVPNFELGHLEFNGAEAEATTSAAAREREELPWDQYAQRLSAFLRHLEFLFSPELFILGGGISKNPERFVPMIDIDTELKVATNANNAGIIGAALQASRIR